MTKFVFVTGGVVSSLGKGIAAASMAALLGISAHPSIDYNSPVDEVWSTRER